MFVYFAAIERLEKKVDLKPSIEDLIEIFRQAFSVEKQGIAKLRDIQFSTQLDLKKVITMLEKKLKKHADNPEKLTEYQQKLQERQAEQTKLREEKEQFENGIDNHPLKKLIGALKEVKKSGRKELLELICKHFYNYKEGERQGRDFSFQWGSRALEHSIVLPLNLRFSQALENYLRNGNTGQSTGISFSVIGSKKHPIRTAALREKANSIYSKPATAEKFIEFIPEKPFTTLLSFLQLQEALELILHTIVTCNDSNLNKLFTELFCQVIQNHQTLTNSHIIALWDFAQFEYRVNGLVEELREHAPQQAKFLSDRLERARVEVACLSDDDNSDDDNCSQDYRLYKAYHAALVAYLQKDDLFEVVVGKSIDPSNTLALFKPKEQTFLSSTLEKFLTSSLKEGINLDEGYFSDSDADEADASWRGIANWKIEMKELLVSPFCSFSPLNTKSDDPYVRAAHEQFKKRDCHASCSETLFPAYQESPAKYGFYDAREVVAKAEAVLSSVEAVDTPTIEGAQTTTVDAPLASSGNNSAGLFVSASASVRILEASSGQPDPTRFESPGLD